MSSGGGDLRKSHYQACPAPKSSWLRIKRRLGIAGPPAQVRNPETPRSRWLSASRASSIGEVLDGGERNPRAARGDAKPSPPLCWAFFLAASAACQCSWPLRFWRRIIGLSNLDERQDCNAHYEVGVITRVRESNGGRTLHGFNVIGINGRPLVTFNYETEEEATAAREQMREAIARAKLIVPITNDAPTHLDEIGSP
jgi:hypothetical protein